MIRSLLLALALTLLLSPTLVMAQDASSDAEAHALFEAGRTAFAAGRYGDALGYFQHAYDLSHRPELLYNVGQCDDRLRHDAEALAAFEQFLAAVPESPNRAEVESRVALLRQSVAEHASQAPTPPPPDPEPQPEPARASGSSDVGPWVLIVSGGVVAIAGAVLIGVGFADIASVQNVAHGASYASVMDADQQAPILTGIGWVALGVGAAAAIGGVVWAVAGSGSSTSDRVALRVGPGSLSLTGSF